MPPKIMDLDTKTCFVSFARLVFSTEPEIAGRGKSVT